MSDTRPTGGVERLASTSNKKSGMGGLVTGILVLAIVALAIACFTLYSGKKKAETDLADANTKVAAEQQNAQSARDEVRKIAQERDMRISPLILPAEVRGATVGETSQRISKLVEDFKALQAAQAAAPAKAGTPGQTGVTPAQPTDPNSAKAWLETVAKAVAQKSINTKDPIGTDPAKLQLHRGIQIVLQRIGAFSKPISGNPADTNEAVMAFQKANALKADGIIGRGTWGKVREKFDALPADRRN